MKSRGMIVVLAFLLAAGATGAVYLYVSGVKQEAKSGGELATVIVSKADIPAGTDLDPLIGQGGFREAEVPANDLVAGAVTQLSELRGQTTTAAVLQGEQIPAARLSSGSLPGGALGLQKGYQAITVQLDAQQIVGPSLQRGAHVTIYGSFTAATTKSVKPGSGTTQTATQPAVPGLVMPIVADVRVLDVLRSGTTPGQQASNQGALVTLELLPKDAEKVVFTQQNGTAWLALLVPGEEGSAVPPVDFLQLAKK